jgi:hypothetical protein
MLWTGTPIHGAAHGSGTWGEGGSSSGSSSATGWGCPTRESTPPHWPYVLLPTLMHHARCENVTQAGVVHSPEQRAAPAQDESVRRTGGDGQRRGPLPLADCRLGCVSRSRGWSGRQLEGPHAFRRQAQDNGPRCCRSGVAEHAQRERRSVCTAAQCCNLADCRSTRHTLQCSDEEGLTACARHDGRCERDVCRAVPVLRQGLQRSLGQDHRASSRHAPVPCGAFGSRWSQKYFPMHLRGARWCVRSTARPSAARSASNAPRSPYHGSPQIHDSFTASVDHSCISNAPRYVYATLTLPVSTRAAGTASVPTEPASPLRALERAYAVMQPCVSRDSG